MISSPAKPFLVAGVDVVNEIREKSLEMTRNAVDIMTAVSRYNTMMVKGTVLVGHGMMSVLVKEMSNLSVNAVRGVAMRGTLVISTGLSATKKALYGTTQASFSTLSLMLGMAQHIVTGVVSMGGSVQRQGVGLVRSIYGVNTRMLLRIYIASQKFLPESKYLVHLGSVSGVPHAWINASSCHGTQQNKPSEAGAVISNSSQNLQDTPAISKVSSVMSSIS